MMVYHGGCEHIREFVEKSKRVHRCLFILLFKGDDQFAFDVAAMNFHAGDGCKTLMDLGSAIRAGMNDNTRNMH